MRWLITRPQDDAEALAQRLGEMGHAAHIFPLMRCQKIDHPSPNWSEYHALAFTSRNGVAMGGPYPAVALNLPAICVGDATAEAAQTAKFTEVISAKGAGADLSAELVRRADERGVYGARFRVLHISAETVRTDLSPKSGIAKSETSLVVDRLATYTMRPTGAFDRATISAVKSGKISGTICLSPQSAKYFAAAAKKADLTPFGEEFVMAAISVATADELAGIGGKIRVARRPDLENTVDLLF